MVAPGSVGNLFIADLYNHRIRKVAATGTITTVAGTGSAGFSGDGGPATAAQLNYPTAELTWLLVTAEIHCFAPPVVKVGLTYQA